MIATMNQKNILCYGDSNTWGYVPGKGTRFPPDTRWPGVAQHKLGRAYHVVEEGLNGRTTNCDDPIEPYRNGLNYLIPCLLSHRPLALVVLFLGTNNLKLRHSLSAYDIAASAGMLVDTIQRMNYLVDIAAPEILLISPPVIGNLTDFAEMFEGAYEKSCRFAEHYEQIAQQYNCHFLDAASIVTSDDADGIHLSAESHKRFGDAVADTIGDIFE